MGLPFSPEDIKTSYVENESHKTSSERWQKTSEFPKWVRKSAQKPGRTKGGLKKRNWARTCTGEGAVKGESCLYSGSPPLAGRSARTRGALEEGAARGCGGQSTEGPPGTASQRRSPRGWAGAEAQLLRADPGSSGLVMSRRERGQQPREDGRGVGSHTGGARHHRGQAREGGVGCRRSILLCSCVLRQQSPRILYPARLPFQTEGDKEFLRQAKAKRTQHH